MLYGLTSWLEHYYSGFNVFQYLTFRSILGALTALLVSFVIGPFFIRHLMVKQIGQAIRHDGPQSHLQKAGTPTMGGGLILACIVLSMALWTDLTNRFIWVLFFVIFVFGAVGWYDDYLKVLKKNSRGLAARWKYFWQSVGGVGTAFFLFYTAQSDVETALLVPFFKNVMIPLGGFYVVWTYLVVVGTSNAVNLTDGLDGLATMPTVLVAGALGVFAYLTGHAQFADYLQIPYIAGVGELLVVASAVVGAGLGFLWFNTYPAQVFMGDVGALALGAVLGVMAVIVRQEIVLAIMGGIFVLETVSVVLQVASFRLTGRRIFRMAPIHHHFELKGWPEPKVIVRFWIITVILVLVGLSTLKLR